MKFKQYLQQLNDLAKADPSSLDLDVFSARDDEGNGYNAIHYSPSVAKSEDLDIHVNEKTVVLVN